MSRGLNRRRLLGASLVATLSMVACGRKPPRAQAVPPGATVLALPLSAARALAVRDGLSWLARAVYYLGVPAWLGWRLLSG